MKRYAIVRVDKFCPRDLERNYKLQCIGSLHCNKCDLKKNYGDTKEQLVRKIAQASINYYESRPFSEVNFQDMARWIVEFLGVE